MIRVLGRVHPDAHDFWDANWLMTPVEVVAGDFRASIGASLRAEEIHEFRSGLTRVYESPQGEATLQSMEGWLSLRVSIDGAGRLAVAGKVKDKPGPGNELSFQIIGLDQSYLPSIIDALGNDRRVLSCRRSLVP